MNADQDDMTLGEVGRRLVRIEVKLDNLADANTRITRLEQAWANQESRAWQTRAALILALVGVPLSVITAILVALVTHSK